MTLKKPSTSADLLNKGAEGVLMYELQDAQVQPEAARNAAMKAMLEQMASADYQQALGEVEKAERRREVAEERLTRRRDLLEAASAFGHVKNLKEAEAAVSVAEAELEKAEENIRVMRGDCSVPHPSSKSQDKTTSSSFQKTASAPGDERTESTNWKMRIQAEAASRFLRLRACGASPTVHSLLDDLVKWCRTNNVKTDGGVYPKAGYLRTHVLGGKHWTPPR